MRLLYLVMGQAQSSPSPKEFLKRNMALSRGTLEGQKSDEDFKGEVSAKKVLSSNNCLDQKEICLRILETFYSCLFGHGERRWKMLGYAGYTKVWFWAHLKYTVFHFFEVGGITTCIYIHIYIHIYI